MRAIFIVFLLLLSLWSIGQPTGYSYGKQITLQSSQVSGGVNLSNFPVLISVTDNNLRTIANGGHVTNNNGYDIVFTSSNCLTSLNHQIESYNPVTGNYVAWVRVPTLSASANTIIQMYYGKSSVSTNPSSTGVWDANYKGVWHFNNAVTDNTSNGNNLTDNSTANFAGSKIGNGRDLNNSTNVASNAAGIYLQLGNGFFSGMTSFTFEGWVLLDRSDTNWERIFDFGQSTTVNFFLCTSTANGAPAPATARITTNGNANEQGPASGNITNTGSWIHWAVVLDNATSSMTLYKNGASLAAVSGSITLRPQNMEASTNNYFGRSQYAADNYIDAKFDEFRISTSARTAGWITTAYNNQNTPASFYTISAEAVAASLCSALPIELSFFGASQKDNSIQVAWTTSSELNNAYFTIERSADGTEWQKIVTTPGAGTSLQKIDYTYIDDQLPASGLYYYRIHQVDYDGTFSYSKIISVYYSGKDTPLIYTIPGAQKLVVACSQDVMYKTNFYTVVGKPITLPTLEIRPDKVIYDLSATTPGVYIVKVQYGDIVLSRRVIIE